MCTDTIVILITSFVLCALGILMHNFKMYNLLAGYNTMPEKEKKKYNIEYSTKIMRNTFFVASFLLLSGMFISQYFDVYYYYLPIFYPIVIVGMVIFLFVYGSNSKKMKLPEE